MGTNSFLSELFRIVEGALRSDKEKVRNYAMLLAEKLEANGESNSAQRLQKLLAEQGQELRPTKLDQAGTIPVDSESRFPLLHHLPAGESSSNYVFTAEQSGFIEEFIAAIRAQPVLETQGIETGCNLLLYGPPGCGKTFLASYIAEQIKLPLFVVQLDGLISSFLGSTSKNIRAVLDFASRTPCVLLLDEFDAIAKLRDDQQEHGELKRVVNSFIQGLDSLGKSVILIGATNHDQLLDPAVWRRFQYLLRIGLPDYEQRLDLWNLYSGALEWSPKQLKVLTDLSAGFSCAAIAVVSKKLRQRLVTVKEPATLRKALLELVWLSRAEGQTKPLLSSLTLDDASNLTAQLRERDRHLYSQAVLAQILEVSPATLGRWSKDAGEPRET